MVGVLEQEEEEEDRNLFACLRNVVGGQPLSICGLIQGGGRGGGGGGEGGGGGRGEET